MRPSSRISLARIFPLGSALLLCAFLACTSPAGNSTPAGGGEGGSGGSTPPLQPLWDPEAAPTSCSADGEAPALDAALALAGLDRDSFRHSPDFDTLPFLSDPFLLSWHREAREWPAKAGCVEGAMVGPLDHHLAQPHPVAGMIRHLAAKLDRPVGEALPQLEISWIDALEELCAVAGDCAAPQGSLPEELRRTLGPILAAIAGGLEARYELDRNLVQRTPDFWASHGGGLLLGATAANQIGFSAGEDRAYLLGQDRGALYLAAARIAFAIEDADWTPFRDQMGVDFELRTAAGWILVRDGADHRWEGEARDILLQLDLGGDDVYLGEVASNRSGKNAVSVAIDLGGSDHYGYDPVPTWQDREPLLPSDFGGRAPSGKPMSYSNVSRQGGARNGIAMLFDLGGGDDRYTSLRASQGYAHLGVGVLFDDGGDDIYEAESSSQGAAQFGIGLLVDAGKGNDSRSSFSYSQGFGFVGGAGVLVDGGGDDRYLCDNGDPAHGGFTLYPSSQLPEQGNSSFCQGAGFGARLNPQTLSLSGGLGILRDLDGDDSYEASVFAQGAGFWQGTGILSDGGGADTYDAFWYVQGGAAHYALGILADAGPGGDVFGARLPPRNMSQGAGHDVSTGVLIQEEGDDVYHLGNLAGGASNCNGLGLFVDNGGDDRYVATSDRSMGVADLTVDCFEHKEWKSIGILIDAGGSDGYSFPASSFPTPAEGGSFGHARGDLPSEHGAGIDTVGESGIHVESRSP